MNSLPKIALAFLAVVAALIIIFIGTRSKTETTQIEAPTIKHVVTDIPIITSPEAMALPDFASYADVKEKKLAFFNFQASECFSSPKIQSHFFSSKETTAEEVELLLRY